jgi:FKBP-type peptidyl-prolyl cis-trans isomerase SlyD
VVKVDDDAIIVDGNHPLAGKYLNFKVTVQELRAATEEEIALGHIHQGGGCCGGGGEGGECCNQDKEDEEGSSCSN